MDSLIKGLQKNGFTVCFTSNDSFNIMDYNWVRTFANVKKGTGRKVLIKAVTEEEYTICNSQKATLDWFLNNYSTIAK